eukprot:GHVN01043761.1.p1 GENE.GHVN01043761.1~~GHVN01043761.1.p1  ORF type:complete len:210 (+),score=21.60 GHVN01043761.1:121-750(+)
MLSNAIRRHFNSAASRSFATTTMSRSAQEKAKEQGRVVFINNIPYGTPDTKIEEVFNSLNPQSVSVYSRGGRPIGVGHVIFETPQKAKQAVDEFNDYELADKQKMAVSIAAPLKTYGADRRNEIKQAKLDKRQVFVSNIPFDAKRSELLKFFAPLSPVTAYAYQDQLGKPMCCGLVVFGDEVTANMAVEQYNNKPMEGDFISVKLDTYD